MKAAAVTMAHIINQSSATKLGVCANATDADANASSSANVDRFGITSSCALFDFAVYTVAMGSLSLLGVAGNTVSFAVLTRDRGRSATSFLLQALAVGDTLVLVAAVPLYIVPPIYLYTGLLGAYYDVYLHILPVLWPVYLIPYTFTILVTVLVSLHRYCAVCRPFRCGGGTRSGVGGNKVLCTSRQARQLVAALAVFSIVYNIPRFFEYERVERCVDGRTRRGFEISAFGDNLLYRIIYANALYFVVIHGGPLLLISFFNVRLIGALKLRQQRWAEMGKSWYQQDVSLVLVVVMCVFIVCQTPTFVDHVLWTVLDESRQLCGQWHYYYTAIGDLLAILNSSVNFVIYILTSRNFRHGLMLQTVCTPTGAGGATATGAGAGAGDVAPFRSEYIGLQCTVVHCPPSDGGGGGGGINRA